MKTDTPHGDVQVSPEEEPVVVSKGLHKSDFPRILPLLIFGQLIGIAILAYLLFPEQVSKYLATRTQTTPTPTSTPTAIATAVPSSAPEPTYSPLFFHRGKDVFYLSSTQESVQVTNTNGSIVSYLVTPDKKAVVYILGRSYQNENKVELIDPVAVYLQKIGSKPEKIYQLEPLQKENADYRIMIRSIAISPDGEKIYISTSDSLFVYHRATRELSTVFSKPIDTAVVKDTVYSYTLEAISPDGKLGILNEGHYEWKTQSIIDLSTGKTTPLSFSIGNGGGAQAIGWLDNVTLVSQESQYENPISKVNLLAYPSLSVQKEILLQETISSWYVDQENLYVVSRTLAPFESTEVTKPGIEKIERIHLPSGKRDLLFSRERVPEKYLDHPFVVNGEVYVEERTLSQGAQMPQTIFMLRSLDGTVKLEESLQNAGFLIIR